jgi:hypothetical protein
MGLFKVRRTTTPGLIPAGLTYGEMAVNLADRILYVGGTAENAIEIAGGSGNYRFFYQQEAPGLSQGYGTTGETGQYDYLVGSRWVDSDTGREYIYIGDGDNWYWVEPPGGGGGSEGTWIRPDPTTATDVAGIPAGTTGLVGENSIQILERILYPYQRVSFSNLNTGLGATQFELGQTAGNGSKTVTWTASSPPSNWIDGSGVLRYSGFVSGTLLTGFNPTANTATVTYPAIRSTSLSSNTFTLQITGAQVEGTNPSATTSARWWSRLYWGKSTSTSHTNPLTLTNGSSDLFSSVGTRSFDVSEGNGYFYLFLHNNYKLDSIFLGVLPLSLTLPLPSQPSPVTVTNVHGSQQQYKIYRSNQILNGSLSLNITTSNQ